MAEGTAMQQARDQAILEAAQVHQTPLYFVDAAALRASIRQVASAFSGHHPGTLIAYSCKTNYLPQICRMAVAEGCGLEVVSAMELDLALALEVPRGRIIYNGPVKAAGSIERAVAEGIGAIIVETAAEAAAIGTASQARTRPAAVGVRVRPQVTAHQSPDPTYRGLPGQSLGKFGYPLADGEALEFCRSIARIQGIELNTLHFHIGPRVMRIDPYLSALDQMCDLAADLRADRVRITQFDIGGGFAAPGVPHDLAGPLGKLMRYAEVKDADGLWESLPRPFPFDSLAKGVREVLERHGMTDAAVLLEPGRALVQNAVVLVGAVQAIKRTRARTWLLLDAGIQHLVAADGGHPGYPIRLLRPSTAAPAKFAVAGPLCLPGDYFSAAADLPADVEVGDLLAIENAGAYSLSRAVPFGTPRAAAVVWDGTDCQLCWERETWRDVFGFDPQLRVATGR